MKKRRRNAGRPKLVGLHALVPDNVMTWYQGEARSEGLPLSIYVRRILTEVMFNRMTRLQGEITDAKQA